MSKIFFSDKISLLSSFVLSCLLNVSQLILPTIYIFFLLPLFYFFFFFCFLSSKKKLCIIYGKWTECMWSVDPQAYEAHKTSEKKGDNQKTKKNVRPNFVATFFFLNCENNFVFSFCLAVLNYTSFSLLCVLNYVFYFYLGKT